MRGCRLQLHWHENPDFRFQPAPDRCVDPTFNENLALLAELGLGVRAAGVPEPDGVRDASWSGATPT